MKNLSLKYILSAFAFIAFVCYEMNAKRELEKKISDLEKRNYGLESVVEENESRIERLEYDISDVQDKVNDHQGVLDNYEYRIWRLERSW